MGGAGGKLSGSNGRSDDSSEERQAELEQQGAAALQQERYDEAAQAYRQVLAREPERALSWDGLARAELGLGHYDHALQAFNRALALDPGRGTDGWLWTDRGYACLGARRWQEALVAFDHALRLEPARYAAWVGKVRALVRLHRYRAAWSAFKETVLHCAGTPLKRRWER